MQAYNSSVTNLDLFRDLFGHQAWADSEVLRTAARHPEAASDEKLLDMLHHIILVQRVFHSIVARTALDIPREQVPLRDLALLQERYAATQVDQRAYLGVLDDAMCGETVVLPWVPTQQITVAEVLLQVALHSQNHRGQCLARLREITGKAPMLDYIIWQRDGRPASTPSPVVQE